MENAGVTGEASPGPATVEAPTDGPEAGVPLEGPSPLARLEEAVRERPGSFGLFQALRLIERMRSERSPLGGFGDPTTEVARLSHNPSLAFPPREIESFAPSEEGPHRLTSNVMGLVGSMGVLPHPYSTLVLERERERDRGLRAFLDIFHHRILSLLYAAWRKGRPELALERDEEDTHLHHLLDLAGMGHEPKEAFGGLPAETVGWYMGLLASPNRSAVGLEQLLSDRFAAQVEVESFVGGWVRLDGGDLCLLGDEAAAETLGGGAVLGDEVWDPHARIRIRVGPLDRAAYDRLLPGGADHDVLQRLVRFYTNDRFGVELQLVLARDEVPATTLGGDGAPGAPLGWGTWLRSRPAERDADETILTL